MYVYPIVMYFMWAIVYYLINFVIKEEKIRSNKYDTSYMYFGRKKWLSSNMTPKLFMIFHFIYFLLTLNMAVLCFHYKWLNLTILLILLLVSFWNGAGYYMSYFAKNYER